MDSPIVFMAVFLSAVEVPALLVWKVRGSETARLVAIAAVVLLIVWLWISFVILGLGGADR